MTYSLSQRQDLLRICACNGVYVFADEVYETLHFPSYKSPPPPLPVVALSVEGAQDILLSFGSFAKTLSPGEYHGDADSNGDDETMGMEIVRAIVAVLVMGWRVELGMGWGWGWLLTPVAQEFEWDGHKLVLKRWLHDWHRMESCKVVAVPVISLQELWQPSSPWTRRWRWGWG